MNICERAYKDGKKKETKKKKQRVSGRVTGRKNKCVMMTVTERVYTFCEKEKECVGEASFGAVLREQREVETKRNYRIATRCFCEIN